jgi:hypothetical protein
MLTGVVKVTDAVPPPVSTVATMVRAPDAVTSRTL